MKKVLFTATVDSHILHFHLPYLKMFKEKGYEVHVATNTDDAIPFCDVKHKISFERSPFKINNLKAIKQMKKILLENDFDIVHTHTPMGSVVTRLAYKKVRNKINTRMIYTAHGFHFYKGAPLLNWLLFYPVEKYLSKYTDTLITINKEDYELAKKKFKKCRSIEYVPGVGIDEDKFNFTMTKSEKLELRKSLGLKENDFVLIYPAEISKRKRHIWLINTISPLLRENRHIHLLLPGSDSLNGKAHALTKKMGLTDQIHFLGYRKDIPKLLKVSDISLSAASQEGLPVNIMEAMYVGLPIVATDCRGNRDLVKDGKNGYLVDLGDKKGFVDDINKVYLKKETEKFGKNNKIFIKNYLINAIVNKIDLIYFNRKKKICHVVSGMLSGGAESFLINYFSEIDVDKYELHILYQHNPLLKSLKEFESLGFTFKRVPSKRIRPIENFFVTYSYFKNNHIDIVHAHMTLANFFPLIAARIAGVPIRICHAHSCNNGNINILKEKIDNQLKFINYKNSTDHLACGIKAGQYMYGNKKFKLIPNAINVNKFKYSQLNRNRIREHYKIDDNCILIGHVGSFSTTKNHIFMLNLIEQLPEYKYKIMFIGNGKLFEQIKKNASRRGLIERVIFVGVVDNPWDYYSAFDLFILPSLWEGLPMVSIEAQANGLNCIISDNVDDSCKINGNLKFLPLNLQKWNNYICSLNLKRVTDANIINSYYNIERSTKTLEKIYDREVF